MKNTIKIIIKDLLLLLLFSSAVGYGWYLAVYKASFLPNGYEIVSQEKDQLTLKSFNIFGMEEETETLSFSERNEWVVLILENDIERLKGFLWLLFFGVTVMTGISIYRVRQGIALWKLLLIGIPGSIPIPLINIISSMHNIQRLMNFSQPL